MASDKVVVIEGDNWQSDVLDSEVPVLVDFWAEWCGPCRAIAPILEELSEEKDGSLKVAKVDVDEHKELAGEFGIRSIPTLLLIKGGEVQAQIVGAVNKSALLEKVEPHLGD